MVSPIDALANISTEYVDRSGILSFTTRKNGKRARIYFTQGKPYAFFIEGLPYPYINRLSNTNQTYGDKSEIVAVARTAGGESSLRFPSLLLERQLASESAITEATKDYYLTAAHEFFTWEDGKTQWQDHSLISYPIPLLDLNRLIDIVYNRAEKVEQVSSHFNTTTEDLLNATLTTNPTATPDELNPEEKAIYHLGINSYPVVTEVREHLGFSTYTIIKHIYKLWDQNIIELFINNIDARIPRDHTPLPTQTAETIPVDPETEPYPLTQNPPPITTNPVTNNIQEPAPAFDDTAESFQFSLQDSFNLENDFDFDLEGEFREALEPEQIDENLETITIEPAEHPQTAEEETSFTDAIKARLQNFTESKQDSNLVEQFDTAFTLPSEENQHPTASENSETNAETTENQLVPEYYEENTLPNLEHIEEYPEGTFTPTENSDDAELTDETERDEDPQQHHHLNPEETPTPQLDLIHEEEQVSPNVLTTDLNPEFDNETEEVNSEDTTELPQEPTNLDNDFATTDTHEHLSDDEILTSNFLETDFTEEIPLLADDLKALSNLKPSSSEDHSDMSLVLSMVEDIQSENDALKNQIAALENRILRLEIALTSND